MPKVDFNYYQNSYYGTNITSSTIFNRIVDKAERFLNVRLTEVTIDDTYKKCICSICDNMFMEEKQVAEIGNIKSETVGSWSRTYDDKKQLSENYEKERRNILIDYYGRTGLLYRGR